MNRQGSLEKLTDYLRAEAIRLLIESSVGPMETVHTTNTCMPLPISPPHLEALPHFSSSCPITTSNSLSGLTDRFSTSVDAAAHNHRRPSAPIFIPLHPSLRRGSCASSTNSQSSSIQGESNSMATILAQAKANVTHELRFQATMGDKKKAAMLDDLTTAYIQLDEGFRRWTEEVTLRSLNARTGIRCL